jgi:hypothetical protein
MPGWGAVGSCAPRWPIPSATRHGARKSSAAGSSTSGRTGAIVADARRSETVPRRCGAWYVRARPNQVRRGGPARVSAYTEPVPGVAGIGVGRCLTGPRTASSGEAVTIAFRGRPRTRSFGLPTAGLSTSNGTFPLPDGAALLLTTAIEADRTGRRYGDKIEPDQLVENDPTKGDPAIEAATQWLRASSTCGAGAK